MHPWLDWLLRLDRLRPDEAGVVLSMDHPLPAWAWALLALLAVGIAARSYRRLDGPVLARAGLGAARAGLLVLLAFLACGPKLQRPNESVEQDVAAMLVDRSASLKIEDDAGAGARRSRDAQLRALLGEHRAGFDALARGRIVTWLGFDAGVFELRRDAAGPGPVQLAPPEGQRSDLGAAIDQALARVGARPLSGLVVFSDGRSSDQVSKAALRKLAAQKIPVFVVPLGSAEPIADVAVRSVQGPGVAFAGDIVPVEAEVERTGRAAGTSRLRLVDKLDGRVIEEQTIDWSAAAAGNAGTDAPTRMKRTFSATPSAAGKADWEVRVEPDGPDLVSENNAQSVRVELVDRPLRVVYFDGYPRWEYRYLQATLTREKSLASTAMLLSAGRRFIQEGNTPLDALPQTPEEWGKIDVIVLGDVNPDVFSPEQLRQIRQRVAVGGAGLLWIGGSASTPGAWRATPLGDLLPIQSAGGDSEGPRTWDRDVVMSPTPVADRLGVLRLLRAPEEGSWWPAAVSDPESGWSRLRWAQALEPAALKPAAEALAMARPVGETDAQALPIVVTMRFGAGRSIFVGTDEIWRWRYGRGSDLPERFWLQLIRLLGRESVSRAGQSALITFAPAQGEVGRPVRVQVELLDQGAIEAAGSTLSLKLTRLGAEQEAPVELLLRRTGGGASAKPTYSGTWVPTQRGVHRASIADGPLPPDRRPTADVEVFLADDELRRPESDHAMLAALAKETGGGVLRAEDLKNLDELLPRRALRVALAPDEHALWDTPLALILILLLASVEWIGRRLIRLA
jgi:hypothetical protein